MKIHIKESRDTKRLCMAGLLLALGIILPMIFHLSGIPQSGAVFLPMHIPALLAGFFLGPFYGLAVGMLSPILSSLLTGMPTAARLPFMIIELAAYGVASGFIYRKIFKIKGSVIISLIGAMAAGRLIYGVALWVAAELLQIPCGGPIAVWNAAVVGIYGILLQLFIIPPVVYTVKKGGVPGGST